MMAPVRYVRSLPGLGWLMAAAVLFTVAVFAVAPLRLPLGWDEITYIAQTSVHPSPVVMPLSRSPNAFTSNT